MSGTLAKSALACGWHTTCSTQDMGTFIETRLCFSAADWIAYARIGQMIEDVLADEVSHVDLDAPTLIRESYRDTLIDL